MSDYEDSCVKRTMTTALFSIVLKQWLYLLISLSLSSVSGSFSLLAPALNNVMAGCSTNLLLERSQQFCHRIHYQVVQGVDNQVVNKSDEAEKVRDKEGLDWVNVIDILTWHIRKSTGVTAKINKCRKKLNRIKL